MINKNYALVHDYRHVSEILRDMGNSNAVALDLETTGLDYVKDKIHGVAIATDENEYYITRSARDEILDRLAPVLNNHKKVYMHNGLFDLHFLAQFNVRPKNLMDTMVGQWMIDENQEVGLKTLAGTKLGFADLPDFGDLMHLAKKLTGKSKLGDVSIYDMPLHLVAEYAAKDARLTYTLGRLTESELEKQSLLKVFFDIEMPFLYVILDMENNGFLMDTDLLKSMREEFKIGQAEHLDKFNEQVGVYGLNVNINSNKQLSELLYGVMGHTPTVFTKKNEPSVDVLALTRLSELDETGVAGSVLGFRTYEKLINTYIDSYLENIHPDGRLRARFNRTGAVTGRLSSSAPTNLMNIPSRGEHGSNIKKAFIAPEGYVFIDIDYSQLELRIAGHYSKDKNLIETFLNNGDPHQLTADLCGVPRYVAKTLNFGVLYGSGARTLCTAVEKTGKPRPSEKEASEWLERFDIAYPTIKNWKALVIAYAKQIGGSVTTISGRKRRLPDLFSRENALRFRAERQAPNSIIQGSAADIIQKAMLDITPVLKEVGGKMLAQVHDELCFEVPVAAEEYFSQKASEIMVAAGGYYNLRVPLVAEPGSGSSWGVAKKG